MDPQQIREWQECWLIIGEDTRTEQSEMTFQTSETIKEKYNAKWIL